jgi:transposase
MLRMVDAAQDMEGLTELIAEISQDPRRAARRIRHLEAEVAKLEEEKRLARAERFAASAERNEHQARLFDEAEQAARAESSAETPAESEIETIEVAAHTKRRPVRKPLPADLPRVVVEHAPTRTHCDCGAELVKIGSKTSEQLEIIPAQVYVVEHRRPSYRCPCCVDAVPETAPLPPQPIPKSIAGPGFLAHVAVAKYADGLPLYRQSAMFARLGIEQPRQTLACQMVRCGELIQPLIERFKSHACGYDVLHVDETRVQVLKDPEGPSPSEHWMWVLRGGPPRQPVLLFHYDRSRGSTVPVTLLSGYHGYLHTDGYAGYGAITRDPTITGLGCWAHVRRKFIKAQQALPKGQTSPKLHEALSLIGKLYGIERLAKELKPEERYALRQTHATPILTQFKAWLDRQDVNPQGLLGKAITYTQREWSRLVVYLEDGRLAIDNNIVENAIRPFAIGRKNWLFSDTVAGAKASANLYSLIETAKANGLNEYAYLRYVFTELPKLGANNDPDALLPWNVTPRTLDQLLIPPKV